MNNEAYIKRLEATIERLKKSLKGVEEFEDFRTLYTKVLAIFMRTNDEQLADKMSEATKYIESFPYAPPVKTRFDRQAKDLLKWIEKRTKNKVN